MIAHRALSQRGALPQLVSLLHTSSLRLWPDVVIPPLGESVSEGTVSTLTKKVGDKVSVDEIVAQLETDKVTIDVKSAHAGFLTALQVKVGDTVKPGTVVCSVGDTATAGTPPAQSAAPSTPTPAPAPSTSQASVAEPTHGARKPLIHFPPRVTAAGKRISNMPAAEADAAVRVIESGHATAEAHAAADAAAAAAKAAPPPPAAPAKPAKKEAAQQPRPVFGAWVARFDGKTRRTLKQSEIDMINSGGAM